MQLLSSNGLTSNVYRHNSELGYIMRFPPRFMMNRVKISNLDYYLISKTNSRRERGSFRWKEVGSLTEFSWLSENNVAAS